MNDSSTPRVLLLTNNKIHSRAAGGAILLANLFHKFPRGNILCVHAEDTDVVADGYREHRLQPSALRPVLLPSLRILAKVASQLMGSRWPITVAEWKALIIQACQFQLSSSLDREIREFRPDVIYAWVGDSVWIRLLRQIATRYRIPYVVHFMDNHVDLIGDSAAQRAIYSEYRRNLHQVIRAASGIFTISGAMAAEYQRRFGVPCHSFHASLDSRHWPWPTAREDAGVFSLIFTGSIESAQRSGLRDVASAVDRLAQDGHNVRLSLYVSEVYEPRARDAFREFKNISYIRHPDSSGLRRALQDADVLVLAYGFSEECVRYYRYSFATKTVPYMLSGRCILAYGPGTIEPIAYLQRGGYAYVVALEGPESLETAIRKLMNDAEGRERIARSAYEHALYEHDLETSSERFLTTMKTIATSATVGARIV
jgi:glycosyltransferase involved in cell wall biosynthesis